MPCISFKFCLLVCCVIQLFVVVVVVVIEPRLTHEMRNETSPAGMARRAYIVNVDERINN